MWTWIILAILVFVLFLPRLLERSRKVIGPTQRQGVEGGFAQLSQGVTHYKWIGPVRGPILVAVHGLTSPSIIWDVVAKGVAAMGYRVLVYDLYGRGLSDAPAGKQNRAFFLQQLSDLLADQGIEEDITFLGYSMGGGIVTAFASENPHRIKRIILLATSGVLTNESRFSRFCRVMPLLGDWLHGLLARRRIRTSILTDMGPTTMRDLQKAQLNELKRQGFLPAVLASRRGMLTETHEAEHRQLGRDGVPVVAIWGEEDTVVPIAALGVLAQWNRAVRQEVVSGAYHALPYSHGTQVIEALRTALRD